MPAFTPEHFIAVAKTALEIQHPRTEAGIQEVIESAARPFGFADVKISSASCDGKKIFADLEIRPRAGDQPQLERLEVVVSDD